MADEKDEDPHGISNSNFLSFLERPLPMHRKRVFISNSTGAVAFRPGFRFPRQDARLHDGDEVQFKGHGWFSIVPAPPAQLRGNLSLLAGHTGMSCVVSDNLFLKCSQSNPVGASLKIEDVRWGKRVHLVAPDGRYCVDLPAGIRCGNTGKPSRWESFELKGVGHGKVSLKGGRSSRYCRIDRDNAATVVCDGREAADFELKVANGTTPLVLSQNTDPSHASTFVVGRKDINSRAVTLQCKGHGYYLSVNARNHVGCFSRTPWNFHYIRLNGSHWWNAGRGWLRNPQSLKYLRADNLRFGGFLLADSSHPRGYELFTVTLTAGYETVFPMVRGVNLGNWFVLEKWMDHKIFYAANESKFLDECAAIDEYDLMHRLGLTAGKARMEAHWSTWITESDIIWLSKHGINTVRVPFGYWMTHAEAPFIDGQFKYMKRLFKWCEMHSVAVILDFHGLKGSQQGSETSGNCGACMHKQCGKTLIRFMEEQETNLAVIETLVSHFARSRVLFGFGVANEVGGGESHQVMSFYQAAFDIIRKHCPDIYVFLSTTYNPSTWPFQWESRMAVDNHLYYRFFEGGAGFNHTINMERARDKVMKTSIRWPMLMGEWSLGGAGVEVKKLDFATREAWYREFARAQLQAYEQHSMGWLYWSYKTIYPGAPYNFREMCEKAWLPGCAENFSYGAADWWGRHPCSYAYLVGQHMGNECPAYFSMGLGDSWNLFA